MKSKKITSKLSDLALSEEEFLTLSYNIRKKIYKEKN